MIYRKKTNNEEPQPLTGLKREKKKKKTGIGEGWCGLGRRENTFWGPCAADPKVLDKDGRQPPGLWTC